MKKQIVLNTICYAFIILFVYAATTKLLEYEKFTIQIGQSPLLTNIAGFIGWSVPTVEIVVAAMLAFSRTRLPGLYLGLGLMVMFTAYIFAVLNFSHHVPCSCGGILEQLGWKEHFVFNLGFVALALAGIRLQSGARSEGADASTQTTGQ